MKLCRFESIQNPGQIHSGIFYENRIYETDGKNPVAVHELSNIRLLSPVGRPNSIRIFKNVQEAGFPGYCYLNPSHFGTQSEWILPSSLNELDFEVRIASAIGKPGEEIEIDDAESYILGYTIFLNFIHQDPNQQGTPSIWSRDFKSVIGPFLVTAEEFSTLENDQTPPEFWKMTLRINKEIIFEGKQPLRASFPSLIKTCSQRCEVLPGDLLCSPAFEKESLLHSKLGRFLLPGDIIYVSVEGLGTLVFKVS